MTKHAKPIKHIGNLIVTAENLAYALIVTEVTGDFYNGGNEAQFTALTEVTGDFYNGGNEAQFTALTKTGDFRNDGNEAQFTALTETGDFRNYGNEAQFTALTKTGDFRNDGNEAQFTALTKTGDFRNDGNEAQFTALTETGYFYNDGNEAQFTALTETGDFRNDGNEAQFTALTKTGDFRNDGNEAQFTALTKTGYFTISGRVINRDLVGVIKIRTQLLEFDYIDYSTMIIHGWRSHGDYWITKARYFGGGDLDDLECCYVAKQGDLTAHGDTIKEAITDLQFKIVGADDLDEVIARVLRQQTVSMAEYHAITGACHSGQRQFVTERGVDLETAEHLPLDEVLAMTAGAYGGDVFAEAIAGAAQ